MVDDSFIGHSIEETLLVPESDAPDDGGPKDAEQCEIPNGYDGTWITVLNLKLFILSQIYSKMDCIDR